MRQDTTFFNSGSLGNSQAQNTLITLINAPGPGRYRIWGSFRHSLADGVKLTSPQTITFPSSPNVATNFGPFVMDIVSTSTGINLALAVATGASDTASAVVYAEKINA